MGLEPGHGRSRVVQDHHDHVCLIVDGVHQPRHGGVKKGGIPANRDDRLVHAEALQFAEPGGHANARSHGGTGFHGPEHPQSDTARV